ncbi:beta-ketoacyl synthase N-terminal-like domain-containing protein [Streptomyces sp. NPDC015127]|uniref:beta-ketoacyl synthase N-terminal-like domain-containing protein n=1 Tax=Streptomyces sp. NPDC015127 TaxID=3364939 RepID=UPI0036F5C7F7
MTGPGGAGAELVITGIGVLAPTGLGTESYWRAALRGESAIGPVRRFDATGYPVRLAGELPSFDPAERVPGRLLPQTDVWTQQGLAALEEALADAELATSSVPEYEFALATASSAGGVEFGQREIQSLWRKGPRHVGAYQSIAWFYAATTGQVSIRHGLRGHCDTFVSEAAGGLDSFAGARRAVEDGAVAVVCGATDSALSPYGLVCQWSGGQLSERADAARAYLPFTEEACGHVPGEGGAMFVAEERAAAERRGAPRCYGVVAGHASTFSPPPGSGRPPTLRRAVESALSQASLAPADVDVVYADALAVPEADRTEAETLCEVFGPYGVPVTAPKAGLGRLFCGGSALDVATALLSMRDGLVPPTPHVRRAAAEYRLDLVTGAPRRMPVRNALVVARGYGGFNSALVLRAPGPRGPRGEEYGT